MPGPPAAAPAPVAPDAGSHRRTDRPADQSADAGPGERAGHRAAERLPPGAVDRLAAVERLARRGMVVDHGLRKGADPGVAERSTARRLEAILERVRQHRHPAEGLRVEGAVGMAVCATAGARL